MRKTNQKVRYFDVKFEPPTQNFDESAADQFGTIRQIRTHFRVFCVYVMQPVKGFYRELFTISTGLSTGARLC